MSEKLYEPLPDLDTYLKRIGAARKQPSAAYLDELIYAHQCSVPFDDLDISEKGLDPSLGKADLFEKIVVRRRGGYCFELNGLFYSLLKELGFEVRASMARVLLRPIPYPLISHRANIVTIDGSEYLVDVGFGGPMPTFGLKLEDGFSRTELEQTFTSHRLDDYWWDIGFTGSTGEEKIVLRACAMPSEEHDFVPLSFFQSQNPQSVFRSTAMANLRTADGAHNIRGRIYTRFQNGQKTETEITDDALFDKLLAEHFGIQDWR